MKKITLFVSLLFLKSSLALAYPIEPAPVDNYVDRYNTSHSPLYLNGEEICKSGGCFHFTEGETENKLEKHIKKIFYDIDQFDTDAVL